MILLTTTYELHEGSRAGLSLDGDPAARAARMIEIVYVNNENLLAQREKLNKSTRYHRVINVDGWFVSHHELFVNQDDYDEYMLLAKSIAAENDALRTVDALPMNQTTELVLQAKWTKLLENDVTFDRIFGLSSEDLANAD